MKNEIIVFEDEGIGLNVRVDNNTVWLTQAQMAELYNKGRSTITGHIKNILKEKYLDEKSTVGKTDGANSDKPVKIYNLDMILSVGQRVKSKRLAKFEKWANNLLKLDSTEKDVDKLIEKVDLLIDNSLTKISHELIILYWSIGGIVNEFKENNDSKYGDKVVKRFSERLYIKRGRGFDKRSVERMRVFNRKFEIAALGPQCGEYDKKVSLGRQYTEIKTSDQDGNEKVSVRRLSNESQIGSLGNLSNEVDEKYSLGSISNQESIIAAARPQSDQSEEKVAAWRQSQNNKKIFINLFQHSNLTWSHIRVLLKFDDEKVIRYYLNEIESKKFTEKELIYEIKSKSYERIIANQRAGELKHPIEESAKDPIIVKGKAKKKSEKELEEEIVENVFDFMNEIGSSVMLHDRQHKILINGLTHKVDLVFFDFHTNTFILIDLKIKKVTNQDISQMKRYIEYFSKDSNYAKASVVGFILCETKDPRIVEDENIYQIKYLSEMPKEKELLKIINENKIILLKIDDFKNSVVGDAKC